jgi:hypothetical protein
MLFLLAYLLKQYLKRHQLDAFRKETSFVKKPFLKWYFFQLYVDALFTSLDAILTVTSLNATPTATAVPKFLHYIQTLHYIQF